jgi:hypothetical protein
MIAFDKHSVARDAMCRIAGRGVPANVCPAPVHERSTGGACMCLALELQPQMHPQSLIVSHTSAAS